MNKLQKEYQQVVQKYIDKFCEKQDLEFEGWDSENIGGTAFFYDFINFYFQDIVWDINSNQKKGLIINWMHETIYNSPNRITYFNYTKGLRYKDLDG